jgi:hypothetical protein
MADDIPPQLKRLDDWGDGEAVLVARGKARPEGADPLDPTEAAKALAAKILELARECPADHYLKRVKVRRERIEKGRGYYLELIFAKRPPPLSD